MQGCHEHFFSLQMAQARLNRNISMCRQKLWTSVTIKSRPNAHSIGKVQVCYTRVLSNVTNGGSNGIVKC